MSRKLTQVGRSRRQLLSWLLHSPLLGAAGLAAWPGVAWAYPERAIPSGVDDALDVFQLEAAARAKLDRAAWHFIVNGADDGRTISANRAAFNDWQIRARRLVDVSHVETGVELLGVPLSTPIILAPVGGQQLIHADGELATMRGASARGHLVIASTVSSNSLGEIRAAGVAPLWFQLYPSPDLGLMRHLLALAAESGCGAIVLTVDSPVRGNREAERWFSRGEGRGPAGRIGNLDGYRGPRRIGDAALTWDIIDWLRAETPLKILLKGIVTGEDAALALRNRVDGIIVSNHGGRQEESGRGTLECLPEVVAAVRGRVPVLIDGGFRRGTDIFKALALGARAICIGRPYLYGLGAFGADGVARVLAILDGELLRIMQLAGVPRVTDLVPAYLQADSRRGEPDPG